VLLNTFAVYRKIPVIEKVLMAIYSLKIILFKDFHSELDICKIIHFVGRNYHGIHTSFYS